MKLGQVTDRTLYDSALSREVFGWQAGRFFLRQVGWQAESVGSARKSDGLIVTTEQKRKLPTEGRCWPDYYNDISSPKMGLCISPEYTCDFVGRPVLPVGTTLTLWLGVC